MKPGIVISQTGPETVFNTLRLAHYSLGQGDSVRIFLSGRGVEIDRIEDPEFDVNTLAREVLDAGCGTGALVSGAKHLTICF